MKHNRFYLVGVFAAATLAACAVRAGQHHWGVGARSHTEHSEFTELPFGSGDMGYALVYEYYDQSGLWQIAVDYTPEITGSNGVDRVITPQLSMILEDQWLRAGAGIMSSYIQRDDEDSDWTDLYWQLLLGIGMPVSSFRLTINAYYTFERWGDLSEFDMDDLEYGAALTLQF